MHRHRDTQLSIITLKLYLTSVDLLTDVSLQSKQVEVGGNFPIKFFSKYS